MAEKVEVKKERIEKKASEVRIGIYCSDWPHHLLQEWEDDCKRNYNNIRWIKMYQDHKQARLLETILSLFGTMKADVEEISERVFVIEKGNHDLDELELELIDGGAENLDYDEESEEVTVTVDFSDFGNMQKKLENVEIEPKSANLERIPSTTSELDVSDSKNVLNLIEALEELDDVQAVFHNLEMTDELALELEDE